LPNCITRRSEAAWENENIVASLGEIITSEAHARVRFCPYPVKIDEECQILNYQPNKNLRPTRASVVKTLASKSTQINTFNRFELIA
jgi:hypothetical protein